MNGTETIVAGETSTAYDDQASRVAADVEAAIAQGDWPKAYETVNRAISRGLRHPMFFMVRAQRMEETGHLQFALEDYRKAAAVAPDDAGTHAAVGLCAMKLEDFKLAVQAFAAAVAADPSKADHHCRHAVALAYVGDYQGAQRAHETAIAVDPQSADALASFASMMARRGEGEKARALAQRALIVAPQHAAATLALATVDMSERRYADAADRLSVLLESGVLTPGNRPAAESLLGDALDGQMKYSEAFAAYTRANNDQKRVYASRYGGGRPAAEATRSLIGYFENEPSERWRVPDECGTIEGAFEGHVFLVGFMRSGTTLLEQVLASNPDIVALEEQGLLTKPSEDYLTSVPALDTLATLAGPDLDGLRRDYWKKVRESLPETSARIFIDKQPLSTSRLPLIAKMFPRAKILFALRDPRDVVFSCFRRPLRVTQTQYEFLSLENCARLYSAIMRIGEISREKLDLDLLEHRYEAMVEDFDGRIRAVCDFIGVEWTETMHKFDEHRLVADLRSPSALQVRRPLYDEGIGQWRHYAEDLAPVLPILEPWVEKFGYPTD